MFNLFRKGPKRGRPFKSNGGNSVYIYLNHLLADRPNKSHVQYITRHPYNIQ